MSPRASLIFFVRLRCASLLRGEPVASVPSDSYRPQQPTFQSTGPCWVCGGRSRIRFHQAVLEFSAWREQDPELAAYTGEKIWLWRCKACGFAQPDRMPALPRLLRADVRPALVSGVGGAGIRLDLQGSDLPAHSRDARRARASDAADAARRRVPCRPLSPAREQGRAGAPKAPRSTSARRRTPPNTPACPCIGSAPIGCPSSAGSTTR